MKMTKEKIIIRVGNRLRITLRKYNIYVKDNIRERAGRQTRVQGIKYMMMEANLTLGGKHTCNIR